MRVKKCDSSEIFMQIAIDYAWRFQTLSLPNPAVGCLIVHKNTIIALNAHCKAGEPHAELLACKDAMVYFLERSWRKYLQDFQKHSQNDSQKHFWRLPQENPCKDSKKRQKFKKSREKILKYFKKCVTSLKSLSNFTMRSTFLTCPKPHSPSDFENLIETIKNSKNSNFIHSFISKYHNNFFKKCEIFITLEPCNHYGKTPPCAKLLQKIKPKRIFIAHSDVNKEASGGLKRLKRLDVVQDVCVEKGYDLLFPFIKRYEKKRFLLFKVAHRLDGSYKSSVDKNSRISNLDSRIFTHNMRCVADFIVISGKTLRDDDPLLDTRYARSPYSNVTKLPKIFILTKNIKSIKSYNIKNRDVRIINSIKNIPQKGFGIIEGGFNFLTTLLDEKVDIDCVLGYVLPDFLITETSGVCKNLWRKDSNFSRSAEGKAQDSNSLSHPKSTKPVKTLDYLPTNKFILNDFYLAYTQKLGDFLPHNKPVKTPESTPENIFENLVNIESNPNIIYWLFRKSNS